MKFLKIILIVIFLSVFVVNFSYAGDYSAEKENLKKETKGLITAAYNVGRLIDNPEECAKSAEDVRKKILQLGKPWTKDSELLNEIAYNSCLTGYIDKVFGGNSLPALLRSVDIAAGQSI